MEKIWSAFDYLALIFIYSSASALKNVFSNIFYSWSTLLTRPDSVFWYKADEIMISHTFSVEASWYFNIDGLSAGYSGTKSTKIFEVLVPNCKTVMPVRQQTKNCLQACHDYKIRGSGDGGFNEKRVI